MSTISLFGAANPVLTGFYGKNQVHLVSCIACLKKVCSCQVTEQDKQRLVLPDELPICFSQINANAVFDLVSQDKVS